MFSPYSKRQQIYIYIYIYVNNLWACSCAVWMFLLSASDSSFGLSNVTTCLSSCLQMCSMNTFAICDCYILWHLRPLILAATGKPSLSTFSWNLRVSRSKTLFFNHHSELFASFVTGSTLNYNILYWGWPLCIKRLYGFSVCWKAVQQCIHFHRYVYCHSILLHHLRRLFWTLVSLTSRPCFHRECWTLKNQKSAFPMSCQFIITLMPLDAHPLLIIDVVCPFSDIMLPPTKSFCICMVTIWSFSGGTSGLWWLLLTTCRYFSYRNQHKICSLPVLSEIFFQLDGIYARCATFLLEQMLHETNAFAVRKLLLAFGRRSVADQTTHRYFLRYPMESTLQRGYC